MKSRGEDSERFRRVEALFREAMRHEPSSRVQIVRERSADNPELFTGVMRLLSHVDEEAPLPGSESSAADLRTLAGERERYEIVEVLGEGGMGIVYLARQLEPIRRRVALKVVKLGVDSKGARARFEFERQALAMMDHPHIARVFEAGTTDDGRLYFAMEYVPGLPLTEYCDRVRMPVRDRLALFVSVCRAIQHAHQKGIIHRDVKPSNVLVCDTGGQPTPKIIDFGVARTVDFRLTEHTFASQPGAIVGSLRYMSPEQADGRSLDVDTRTDIYSLGAVLYKLLVGSTPLDDRDVDDQGYAALQRRIQDQEPTRPSERVAQPEGEAIARARGVDRTQLVRELRGDLDWITLKALEKERLLRYPSASELAADVDRYLANQPVQAGPPSARYRLKKFVRRNRVTVAAACAVAVAVFAGLAATTTLYLANRRAMRLAQQQRDEILQLSDAGRLAACIVEADALYPPNPDVAPRMRAWLDGAAGELAQRLPRHRATLERLEREAAAAGSDAETVVVDPEWQFHHDLLSRLVVDLERFADPDPAVGTMASVRERLAFAETIYERSVAARRGDWHAAVASIADTDECPFYNGMMLKPQVGLVPLGRDQQSGLWEFAHLRSGDPPARDGSGRLTLEPESGIVLVLLPGGCYWMGSDSLQWNDPRVPGGDALSRHDERPPHQVCLDPFFISKYEITQGQWLRIAGTTPSAPIEHQNTPACAPELHPVSRVDWETARRVVRRLGMDLPTEAQWEYAARAGETTPWPDGMDENSLERYGNLLDVSAKEMGHPFWLYASWNDGYPLSAPVGTFAANRFGLHDMIGNVWEWCRDRYAPYSNPVRSGDAERAPGVSDERIARGTGYHTTPLRARVSFRGDLPATNTDRLGIRPVRRIDPPVSAARTEHAEH